jgi:hypothetical protein
MKCGETINYTKQPARRRCVVLTRLTRVWNNNKALCSMEVGLHRTSISSCKWLWKGNMENCMYVSLRRRERETRYGRLWRVLQRERWEISSSYPLPWAGNWLTMKWKWDGAALFARPPPNFYYTLPTALPVHTSMTLESSRCMALGKFILLRILERFVFDEIFLFAPWARWDLSWDEMEFFTQ